MRQTAPVIQSQYYDGTAFYVFICIYITLFIPFALRNDCNHNVLLPDKINLTERSSDGIFFGLVCVCGELKLT